MYPELITRPDIKIFLPPIGGMTVYICKPPLLFLLCVIHSRIFSVIMILMLDGEQSVIRRICGTRPRNSHCACTTSVMAQTYSGVISAVRSLPPHRFSISCARTAISIIDGVHIHSMQTLPHLRNRRVRAHRTARRRRRRRVLQEGRARVG